MLVESGAASFLDRFRVWFRVGVEVRGKGWVGLGLPYARAIVLLKSDS